MYERDLIFFLRACASPVPQCEVNGSQSSFSWRWWHLVDHFNTKIGIILYARDLSSKHTPPEILYL